MTTNLRGKEGAELFHVPLLGREGGNSYLFSDAHSISGRNVEEKSGPTQKRTGSFYAFSLPLEVNGIFLSP